jgi:hypothetical protein
VDIEIAKAHRAVSDARIGMDWSRAGLAGYEKRVLAGETGLEQELLSQRQEADAAETRYQQAREVYRELAAAEPPLWADGNTDPVLLLPLRLETVFRTAEGGGPELWIRAYPDDIHVDSHEPGLTPAERAAAEAYWREIWAAGPNAQRRSGAWSRLVAAVGAGRASWAVKVLRPAQDPPGTETPGGADAPAPGPWAAEPQPRDSSWTRAAQAYVLPDRLVFSAYEVTGDGQIGLVWRQEGGTVPETLDVGPGPGQAPPAWLSDFTEAIAVGMGVKVPLGETRPSFALLTVTGVRSGTSERTAETLGSLLESHRCTDGLEVLPTGTPTNNTSRTRSAWRTRSAPPAPESTAGQHAAFAPGSAQAAARAALALGPAAGAVLTDVPGGLGDDDHDLLVHLRAAVGALSATTTNWRAFDANAGPDLLFLISHFVEHVSGRGALPTVRVGRQPYGILPATSLDLWHGTEVDLRILNHISGFRTYAESQGWRAPQVGAGGEPDAVINDLLHRLPVSQRLRYVLQTPVTPPFQPPPDTPIGSIPHRSGFTWAQAPDPDAAPPMEFTVTDEMTAEMAEVMRRAPIRALWNFWHDASSSWPALAPELAERFQAFAGVFEGVGTGRLGLFYHYATTAMLLHKRWLDAQTEAQLPAAHSLGVADGRLTAPEGFVPDAYQWACLAFEQLAEVEDRAGGDLPRIERLLCEVLDTQTHRLDSWMTSVPAARLARLRRKRPNGTHVGAYGWVTDVTARGGTGPQDGTEGDGGSESDTSGPVRNHDGYLIAPSMHHATTAAVLRSGWLSHGDSQAFGINLTASRVRQALAVVDGIRSDQSLAALLGYRLERGLHDAGLDDLISPFRKSFPLPRLVDPGAPGSDGARDAAASQDVVDGQALLADWVAHGRQLRDVVTDVPESALESLDRATPLVADLEATVDGVGDLLVAEGVHHLVGGNPHRAGAAADSIARGDSLPQDFEVIRTPRTAVALTYRLGVLAPAGGTSGWASGRPLAALEPALERWCETRLGDASGWRFDFGDPAAPLSAGLADLGVCALDVVLGAGSSGDAPDAPLSHDTPLVRRLLRQVAGLSGGATPRVSAAGAARFAELQLLCGSLQDVLRATTPLLISHLDPAEGNEWEAADVAELAGRVTAWQAAVTAAVAPLRDQVNLLPGSATTVASLLDALADTGVTHAYTLGPPTDDTGMEALRAQAGHVLGRFDAAPLTPLPPPPPNPANVLA